MGFIVGTIVLVTMLVACVVVRRKALAEGPVDELTTWLSVAKWALVFVVGIFALLNTVHRVENGHVGLVYTFGAITGQRGDGHGGIVVTYPWQDVKEANVQVQAVKPESSCSNGVANCMDAFSNESQDVYISATVNVHVNPVDIQGLYRQIGPDYINKLVLPRVAQITKEETVKFAAKDAAPNREILRETIASRLTDDLKAHSIIVDDFLLTNVDFAQGFKDAIALSVQAEQEAKTEENKVAISKAQADQAVAKAKGEADSAVVAAKGQAEANQTISASLTPELIQYLTVQKLAPNVTVIMPPSDQGLMLNAGNLFTGAADETK